MENLLGITNIFGVLLFKEAVHLGILIEPKDSEPLGSTHVPNIYNDAHHIIVSSYIESIGFILTD